MNNINFKINSISNIDKVKYLLMLLQMNSLNNKCLNTVQISLSKKIINSQ